MYAKEDIENLFTSLMGGVKLKIKGRPWITLPDTENLELMKRYYHNPNCEFSFNVFAHDVELYQVKFGVEADVQRVHNQTEEILKKARESGGIE